MNPKVLSRIQAAHTSQAIRLDLSDCELTEIPPELADLTQLKVLWLFDNQLTSTKGLEALTQLKRLRLSNNQLAKVEGFSTMAKLEVLTLGKNQLTQIAGLEQLTELKTLYLNENKLAKIEGLDTLTHLEKLRLDQNQLTKIEGVDQLIELKKLYLDENQLTKIESLTTLTQLEKLWLSKNQLTKIEGVDKLTQLKKLYLDENQLTKIEGVDKLIQLKELYLHENQLTKIEGVDKLIQLKELQLDQNQLTKIEGLATLTQLKELWLSKNQLTKIEGLVTLTQLEKLYLHENQLTKIEGVDKLIQLKELYLNENQLTEIEGLATLTQLEKLWLRNNQLTKIEGVDKLIQLKELYLNENQLTKIEGLTTLTLLEILSLSKNQLAKIEEVDKLIQLKELYLNENQLTKIEGLATLTQLEKLWLRNNQLTKIEGLDKLIQLKELYLHENQLTKIEGLATLTQLEKLYLHENQLTKIEGLATLTQLKELWLSKNQLTKIEGLVTLSQLEKLYLHENQLTKIEGVDKLIQLKELQLDQNQLTKIEGLVTLSQLEKLYLHENQLTKIEGVDKLIQLKELYLHENQLTKIEGLATLTLLEELSLSMNQLAKIEGLDQLIELKELYLHENQLPKIEGLATLTQLEKLSLNQNKLTKIEGLVQLIQLKELYLYENQLTKIEGLSTLTLLEKLRLDQNKLTKIEGVDKLIGLKNLDVSNNKVTKIEGVNKLTQLKKLYLYENQLTKIEGLDQLIQLETLTLHKNQLSKIEGLETLLKISELYLDENKLIRIEGLEQLTNLKTLDLSRNKIADLTPLLPQLQSLPRISLEEFDDTDGFFLGGNPINDPPMEIVAQGSKAILNHWGLLEEEGAETYLNEARILIVGEGEAGKTSLQRKMLNPDAPLPEADDRTRKIIKEKLTIKRADDTDFTLHLWDFGGQNIQYFAHQFFLSTDAVYVLVANQRRQSPNLVYWLHIIKLLGKGSPALILQNQKNGANADGDYGAELRNHFPILEAERPIDLGRVRKLPAPDADVETLLHSKSMQDLLQELAEYAARLPLNTTPRPPSFQRVREIVQTLRREQPYATLVNLLQQPNVPSRSVVDTHLRTLNVLGECVYHPDDPLLRKYVFLDSQWIIDAMYCLVENTDLSPLRGHFTEQDADRIWQSTPGRYEEMTTELIRLLSSFHLCYSVPDRDAFVAPMLLPVIKQEEVPVPQNDGLRLHFKYDFLPYGIITRLICRLYDWIDDGQVWRDAVILRLPDAPDHTAYIRESYDQKQIIVDIQAPEPRIMADHLIRVIEDIHAKAKYGDLAYYVMVPCPCPGCNGEKDRTPYMHQYSKLLKKIERGVPTIECGRHDEEPRLTAFNLYKREKNAFILHHPAQSTEAGRLRKHLAKQRREGLRLYSEDDLLPGQSREDYITQRLDLADLVYVLLSPSLLDDPKLYKRTQAIIEQSTRLGRQLIPIRVVAGDYDDLITQIHCLPADGSSIRQAKDSDEAWTEIAKSTGRILFGNKGKVDFR